MYLDFEDYRPETPRIPTVISVREGVLLSLLAHAAVLMFILFAPKEWLEPTPESQTLPQQKEPIRYVQIAPAIDRAELAKQFAENSDLDRSRATRERAPNPENTAPLLRGNTPEKIEGSPETRAAGPELPQPPAPAPSAPTPAPDTMGIRPELSPAPATPAAGNLGSAFRNLERYLQDQTFDNRRGGDAEQSTDIQFDSKGVDFGPWLRRFVAQIKRNWLIPQVAELAKGRVVIQFTVLRNGTIVDLHVTQPAGIDALTYSALNALKLSNPTAALPPEYPDDRAPFIVTFHYNENFRETP